MNEMNAKALAEIIRRPLVKEAAIKAVDDYLKFVEERVRDLVNTEPNAVHVYGVVAVPINFISKAKKEIAHSDVLRRVRGKGRDFCAPHWTAEGIPKYLYSKISEDGVYDVFELSKCTDDGEFFDLVIEELVRRGFDVCLDTYEPEDGNDSDIDRDILPQIMVPDETENDDTDVTEGDGTITAKTIASIFFEAQRIEKIKEAAKTAVEQYFAEALKKFEELVEEEPKVPQFAVAVSLAITDMSWREAKITSGDLLTFRDCDMEDIYRGTMAEEKLKQFVISDSDMFTDEVINILSKDMGFELIATEDGLVPLVYIKQIEG